MKIYVDILVYILSIYILASAIFLILDNRKPSSTFAWLFVFIICPLIGIVLYVLFGKNHRILGKKRKKIDENMCGKLLEILNLSVANHKRIKSKILKDDPLFYKWKLINLLENNSFSLLSDNNRVGIFQKREEKFKRLMEDLEKAEKFIHMAYYIWRDDNLTSQIRDVLIRKASEGVKIRILVDPLGSISLRRRY